MNKRWLPQDIHQPYDRAVEELVWQGLLTTDEARLLTHAPRSLDEHN